MCCTTCSSRPCARASASCAVSNPRAWPFEVARNAAVDHARRTRSSAPLPEDLAATAGEPLAAFTALAAEAVEPGLAPVDLLSGLPAAGADRACRRGSRGARAVRHRRHEPEGLRRTQGSVAAGCEVANSARAPAPRALAVRLPGPARRAWPGAASCRGRRSRNAPCRCALRRCSAASFSRRAVFIDERRWPIR